MEGVKFSFARIPALVFHAGAVYLLPEKVRLFGSRCLLVTGAASLRTSGRLDSIMDSLKDQNITSFAVSVQGEPSPEFVDDAVNEFRNRIIDVVVALGGGSAIDAGKAISAMLPSGNPVIEYLEVVGTKMHDGRKVPFIAIPTTAGTGSEATKNAVLSRTGKEGFKRSLRHDNFVPDIAIIDPELALKTPREVTASTGLDALTQLVEAFVSVESNPITDALAWSGLEKLKTAFIPLCTGEGRELSHRTSMAYAALMSGIALANAGLGVVHGLASPLGSLFCIPHGIACGTMLAAATRATIRKLVNNDGDHHLQKYARLGALFTGCDMRETGRACERFVELLEEWTELLNMPRLSSFGVKKEDFGLIIAQSGNKNNPAKLNSEEISEILSNKL
jgi:alcohol dehydrogenase class IV